MRASSPAIEYNAPMTVADASSSFTAPNDEGSATISSAAIDEAAQVLRLTADLHAARGDPAAWRVALAACRDWLGCAGVLDLPADGAAIGPDDLEAIAGRLTHCGKYAGGACGCVNVDQRARQRCIALAPHLHLAAIATRKALQSSLFDHLPPTWIVNRDGRVLDSNASAKALAHAADRFAIVDGCLVAANPGGMPPLRRTLAQLSGETQLSWVDDHGDATLHLRLLVDGACIAATLLPEPPRGAEIAPRLARKMGLTPRQSELAAQLHVGHTLSDAARAMGISRHTANEHLVALLGRIGAPDRKAMLVMLRRVLRR